MARSVATALVAVALLATAACGSGGSRDAADAADPDRPTGQTQETDADAPPAGVTVDRTCVADAKPVATTGRLPAQWPWPDGAVVYDVRPGGSNDSVVVTAVAPGSIGTVMSALLADVDQQGFTVVDSEAEEHDAEAEWTGHGAIGRWAMSEAPCKDEVLIQVVASDG
jgi:hypothetical protein